jgi:hypothetical protein
MLAYLDAGSGAALATLLASGAVGASAVWGTARRKLRGKLARTNDERDAADHAVAPVRSSDHS